MKPIRFLIVLLIVLFLLLPPFLHAEDLNDLAYESRIHLNAGTIWNFEGNGDCLIFPYYDVRKVDGKDQVTTVTIENFGEYGIAAKLRFKDWSRGREVFSKDIWIPSMATWSASIELSEEGTNAIITSPGNVVWRYDSKTFYFTNSLLNGVPFSTRNIRRAYGESTLYGFLEVIGEEKTSPDDTGGKAARLAQSERDCPNTLRGTLSITRVEDGTTLAYDAAAIGNFSRGQGSLFRKPGSPYPRLDNGEDTLDQLEFQLSKWEIFGPFSVDPSNQSRTSLIVTFPTKAFHFSGGRRLNQLNNPYEVQMETQGETLKASISSQGAPLPADSEISLPFSVNVIGLYPGSGGLPTGGDNLSLPAYSYDSGDVKLTSDGMAERILIRDYEYFREMFSTYQGLPALGLILHEYRNPDVLHTVAIPVEFSAVWGESSLESVLFPTSITGPSSGQIGTAYSYTTGGASSTAGHPIQYEIDWNDGTSSGWLGVGVTGAAKTWTMGGVYAVRSRARCAIHPDLVSKWSKEFIVTMTIAEMVSPPFVSGPVIGLPGILYTYTATGSLSSLGHAVQYKFDWGDDTDSNWLPVGVTSAQKVWFEGGTYQVTAKARCVTDTSVVSSDTVLSVNIELISEPNTPMGKNQGNLGDTLSYITGGASSSINDPIEYQIDWAGDGSDLSSWQSSTTFTKTWTKGGIFQVKARARCAIHTAIMSDWSGGFEVTVNNPAPTLASIFPTSGNRSQTLDVTITGTNFISGVSSAIFGAGITVNSTTVNSGTSITANITIGAAAATGPRDVSVINATPGGGTATLTNGFTVNNPVPIITSISPTSKNVGDADFSLTVNGTNFTSDSVVQFNGTDQTTTFVSSARLTAAISANDLTTAGTFSITVFNPAPGGGTSSAQTFTVRNPVPTLASVSPNSGNRLETLDVTFTGTGFITGISSVSFGSGITVNSTTVNSATQITANITIAGTAATGPRNVSVSNPGPGGGTVTLTNGFTVNNPVPTITSILPTSKAVGDAAFSLTVNGTNFISNSVVQFNGSDRTTTFVNSTRLTAAILATDLNTAGTFSITVFNPAPGGGTSNAQTYTVN